MKKAIVVFLCVAGLAGCASRDDNAPKVEQTNKKLVDDPVSAIESSLPDNWVVLRVDEKAHPHYRPPGTGAAVFLARQRDDQEERKAPYDAAVFIMPADYEDAGEDPVGGETQTSPPRLIATTAEAKVYLWPDDASPPWKTMRDDILDAVLE